MKNGPLNLEPIKSRLINAGYARAEPGQPPSRTRETSREAQEARAELRAHVIDDIWALLDEVEWLRGSRKQ